MRIFVGDLPVDASKEEVKKRFEAFGTVTKIYIKNREGGNAPRSYGMVEMPVEKEALAAIAALDGQAFMDKNMSVEAQRPKAEKPKKDYKEIKRLRQEAKLLGTQPLKLSDDVPEIKEVVKPTKAKKVHEPFSGRKGPSTWKKRTGTGTGKAWKKKPGGVKKKFAK